jgi:hypothetical protein
MLSRRSFLAAAAATSSLMILPKGTVSASPPPARQTSLCPPEYADGRDASADLTAWLLSLPPSSVADLGGLTYRVETLIKLDDRTGLTITNGTLVRTLKLDDPRHVYPNPNPFIYLRRPAGCSVTDLKFRGTNTVSDGFPGFGSYLTKYEFDAAIRIDDFVNFEAHRLDVDGVWGDCVQIHGGEGVWISDCLIDRTGRQGISIIASQVLIERVKLLHGRRAGFDLEPNSIHDAVHDVEIRDCDTNTRLLPFASGGNGAVNNVWLHNNVSRGPAVPVVSVNASDGSRRSNWRIEDHTAVDGLGSPRAAVEFQHVDGVLVTRCDFNVKTGRGGAFLFNDCGGACTVTDSLWHGATTYDNKAPAAGQVLTVTGNTPALRQV